jgi:hypothetical protein
MGDHDQDGIVYWCGVGREKHAKRTIALRLLKLALAQDSGQFPSLDGFCLACWRHRCSAHS